MDTFPLCHTKKTTIKTPSLPGCDYGSNQGQEAGCLHLEL
jgi:hypothetical protein